MFKKLTFYHIAFFVLVLGLLYFGIFTVMSLVELSHLERRVTALKGDLETLRQKNQDLRRQLDSQAEPDTAAVSLARHGYRRSNEMLATIEPPPLPAPKEPSKLPALSAWLFLGLMIAAALFFYLKSLGRRKAAEVVGNAKPQGEDRPPPN